ncbi:hypothetical protein [Neobacillus sp. D3-1R]|uniref:hypothetical protein n=1 Tax=Neobacillus sp. D3-1R TaxID=3445778 RepID=UPI003FA0C86B
MTNKGTTRIQRGQAITFRLPSDTPDHIIKQLQKLKETERRNFSSKIAQFTIEGVTKSMAKERETITIPLPKQLSKEQRNWLRHSHSEALLGSIVYQLLADPVRATTVLASLNSHSLDINEALYLQENDNVEKEMVFETEIISPEVNDFEDDMLDFDWEKAKQEIAVSEDDSSDHDEELDADDLLGGFLANMNK